MERDTLDSLGFYNTRLTNGATVQVRPQNLPQFNGVIGTVCDWRQSDPTYNNGYRDYFIAFDESLVVRGHSSPTWIDERFLNTKGLPLTTEYEDAIRVLGEGYFA